MRRHHGLAEFVPTDEQKSVIEAGPSEQLLVIAGPGTGKTQVAAMRLVHLIRSGLQPSQILVLSFSRSAVSTLSKRIESIQLPDASLMEDLRHLVIRTFDSWAFRILRQSGRPAAELLGRQHDENIAAVTAVIADPENGILLERLHHIRHVIVDEFQDLPGVRANMVIELLSRLNGSLDSGIGFTVLGDPAQAIYRFSDRVRGQGRPSDPWEDLKVRIGKGIREIALLKNHRSTEKLARFSESIRKILQRVNLEPQKKLEAIQEFLDRLPASPADTKLGPAWLEQMPEGSVAVLTRTNGEALRVAMMLFGDAVEGPTVPVRLRLSGTLPLVPAWIAALLWRFKPHSMSRDTFDVVYSKALELIDETARSALRIPFCEVAWQRLVRASGLADTSAVIDIDALRERLDWPDSFPDDQAEDDAAVYISTIHQAKGMEFDNVALLESQQRQDADPPEDPLEEANVGFVAITRAGSHLGRIPSSCIYKPPYEWHSQSGRGRQVSWGKMMNFQLGLPGDIDRSSFVDPDIHGSVAQVETLQNNLLLRAAELRGHKVMLKRAYLGEKSVIYDIHLQDGKNQGLLLGRTSQQMTRDLLGLLHGHDLSLPKLIFNLRIADVVTVAGRGEIRNSIPEPWRSSNLWFGISLFGMGVFFKSARRNGN